MSEITNLILDYCNKGLSAVQEQVLEQFRIRTPGYFGIHVLAEDSDPHEHSGAYLYTGDLSHSWVFIDRPYGRQSVAAIVNTDPAAELVEYGYVAADGTLMHGGGHRIVESTLQSGGVRDMYAKIAQQALVASLAKGAFKTSKAKRRTQTLKSFGGNKKDLSVNVFWRKGRLSVRGGSGSGTTTKHLRELTNNLADALVATLNAKV